jgi:hypothetical protein
MNGVLMLSMESGMLLFSQEFQPSFGMSTTCDPFQQSGFLYALYSSAIAQFDSYNKEDGSARVPPLQWYSQGRVLWHFHEHSQCATASGGFGLSTANRRVLVALATSIDVSPRCAQIFAFKLSQVGLSLHFCTLMYMVMSPCTA